jgi:hypothetical protein
VRQAKVQKAKRTSSERITGCGDVRFQVYTSCGKRMSGGGLVEGKVLSSIIMSFALGRCSAPVAYPTSQCPTDYVSPMDLRGITISRTVPLWAVASSPTSVPNPIAQPRHHSPLTRLYIQTLHGTYQDSSEFQSLSSSLASEDQSSP